MFLRLPYFACQVSNKLVTRFKTHCDVVLKTYHCLLAIESSLSRLNVFIVRGKVRTNAGDFDTTTINLTNLLLEQKNPITKTDSILECFA